MTTAFSATAVVAPQNVGYGYAYSTWTLQLSASGSAGGDAWDLSSYYAGVHECNTNGVGPTKAYGGYRCQALGTGSSTYKGVTGASVYIDAFRAAGTGAVFDECDSIDCSALSAVPCVVIGRAV
jgi:hypothetical protein